MGKLEQAFYAYQEKTRAVFQEVKDNDADGLDKKEQLLSAVKTLEIKEQKQYKTLLKSVEEHFSEQYEWDIEKALKTFLRRSGFYLNLFEGKEVDLEKYVSTLENAFVKVDGTADRWYIVPIEGTWLKDKITVSDDFKITSLEAQEWEQELRNRPNKYFYPSCNVNTDILAQYDCLAIRETVDFKDLRRRGLNVTQKSDYISFNHSKFPSLVEEKIGQLILARWESREIDFSSFDHELWFPVVLRVHHSLIDPPYSQPNMYNLNVGPVIDQETGRYIPNIFERETPMEFVAEKTENLSEVLKLSREVLEIIDSHPKWNFIRNALKFFTKAYTSHGYKQLLWYITALDTLLGEGDYKRFNQKYSTSYGSQFRLIERRALYLNKNEERGFQKKFDKLKDLRNNLVHGNEDLSNIKLLKRSELGWLHEITRECIYEIICLAKSVYDLGSFSNHTNRTVPDKRVLQELIHVLERPKVKLSKALKKDLKNDYQWLFTDTKIDLSL